MEICVACVDSPYPIIRKPSISYSNITSITQFGVFEFLRPIVSSSCFHFVSVAKPIGCFKDTGRRAIPGVDGRYPIVRGYYRRRKEAINKCCAVALMRGYKAFAVQHGGWCATGPRAHLTYRKYGRSNRCRNGKGGPWANDVYVVSGKCEIFTSIETLYRKYSILFGTE